MRAIIAAAGQIPLEPIAPFEKTINWRRVLTAEDVADMPFGQAGCVSDIAAGAVANWRAGSLCCFCGVVTSAGRFDALGR
jgi:hypothetical protein